MSFRTDLEAMVMAALKDGPLHGYGIVRAIRGRSEGVLKLGEGQLYPILHRLESDGLIHGDWEIQDGKPPRKQLGDQLDRLVVGIDEASVLFTVEKGVRGANKDFALEARELADKLTKLGRAAGIHVIIATQKITKETVDTRVQTNVGAKICFRVGTAPSSVNVLGNTRAHTLPDIKGRAIWSVGSNDLLQYLFAADRNNPRVSGRFATTRAGTVRTGCALLSDHSAMPFPADTIIVPITTTNATKMITGTSVKRPSIGAAPGGEVGSATG